MNIWKMSACYEINWTPVAVRRSGDSHVDAIELRPTTAGPTESASQREAGAASASRLPGQGRDGPCPS